MSEDTKYRYTGVHASLRETNVPSSVSGYSPHCSNTSPAVAFVNPFIAVVGGVTNIVTPSCMRSGTINSLCSVFRRSKIVFLIVRFHGSVVGFFAA